VYRKCSAKTRCRLFFNSCSSRVGVWERCSRCVK